MASGFRSGEVALALISAVVVQGALVLLLLLAGRGAALSAEADAEPRLVPIAVTPVIDDLPLLKLGSKKLKPKLPDMWRKPKPKRRYEDKSAPTVDAKKEVKERPKNEVAKADETPAPEDAELAKKVDEDIPEQEQPDDTPNLPEEGAEDGVSEGTEVDPLKAFVVNQYRMKVIAWFKRGFSVPTQQIDCATLAGLITRVTATIGAGRNVTGFTLTGASGNGVFDSRIQAHMARKVGQSLPPPPPKYPDILNSIVLLRFSGKTPKCKDANLQPPPKSGTPVPKPPAGAVPSAKEPSAPPTPDVQPTTEPKKEPVPSTPNGSEEL